jgi:hypothetical protein
MPARSIVIAGGLCFIVAALAFVGVFGYLAAAFDYPRILDGSASEVLPRLAAGGTTMRAVWAIYAFLPLLLIPGAVGARYAFANSPRRMQVAVIVASLGAFAMCLGLMRWPSMHWALAQAHAVAGEQARVAIAAMFSGLNLYLGNYVGEFLGEVCLAAFFLLAGCSSLTEAGVARWLGWSGACFALLFAIGAFRNVQPALQGIADLNNALLPLWMLIFGGSLVRRAVRHGAGAAIQRRQPPP